MRSRNWFAISTSQLSGNALSQVVPAGAAAGATLQYRMLAASGIDTAAAGSALTAVTDGHPLTEKGMIVGTFQYMSPEQLQGHEADTRSDLFALGSVLYEMITGRRAFPGKSQISVLSAILEKDPDPITASQPLVPVALSSRKRDIVAM